MITKNKALRFFIVFLGIFISLLSFTTISNHDSANSFSIVKNHRIQPVNRTLVTDVDPVQNKEKPVKFLYVKQPPLNIVASFIMLEAKTKIKPAGNPDKEKQSIQKTIINNLILVFF